MEGKSTEKKLEYTKEEQEEREESGSIIRRLCSTVFHIQNDEINSDEVALLVKWVGKDWEEKVNNLRNSGMFIF